MQFCAWRSVRGVLAVVSKFHVERRDAKTTDRVYAYRAVPSVSRCLFPEEAPLTCEKKTSVENLPIGLIPEQNIFRQMERYEPLGEYLSRKTGTKITFNVLRRYGNIIDSFNSSGLDGAFFGSFSYTLAHAKIGVEVLAQPVALDNTSTYYGMIFVRKDSGIRTVRDMKGKRFAFVDRATTAGYLLPLDYFHHHGISDYNHYLGETYFTGTHEDAIEDVLNMKADIGAAKNTVFQRLASEDPRIMKELVVLTRSPAVPENAIALRKDIDVSVRKLLKDSLLSMHLDPDGKRVLEQFGALKFIETTDKDYDVVREYADHAHLDLSTYEYMNN
ncbi:phosphate/phosphite/phosphonate ABC transporter substrate-binding protein [Candidatus Deferrimicrobium sp.]|uniref:phosphate/phosphite/phosphonate ABC transporter substrate-binding protein n=1 Tax=Candidatus Deferrimicrobium sp. TaxID=3060586 RepID=UPI002ED63DA0